MSKTFNSAHAENSYQQLNIVEVDAGIRVSVDHNSHGAKGLIIAPSDAPALALAILEAAGVEDSSTGGLITGARIAVGELKRHVAKQEREAKADADRVKLEEEALELYQLFESLQSDDETVWLAITELARKQAAKRAEK